MMATTYQRRGIFVLTFAAVGVIVSQCAVLSGEFETENRESEGQHVAVSQTCASPEPLGMENGLIPDSSLTASSWLYYQTSFYGPTAARPNLNTGEGPWVKHNDDQNPWIQVDLEGVGVVTGLQTEGGGSLDKSVTAFKVKYGTTECGLTYLQQNGVAKTFSTSHQLTTHNFPQAVSARFIRIEPTQWTEYAGLSFEVLGCLDIPRCLPGWDRLNDVCYFLAHNERTSYEDAKASCTDKGAQLAIINNQEESDFLGGKIMGDGRQWHGYYIGLDDITTEGTFTWIDGSPLSYTHWSSGEPNNYNNEDCVGLWPNGAGTWNDYPCGGSHTYAYVCEKALDSSFYANEIQNKPLQESAVCASPVRMGMESGQLPSSKISASTVWWSDINGYGWKYSRLNLDKRWIAHLTDNNPWIQVDLYGASNVVSGIITQGAPSNDDWVEKFKVRYGTQDCDMQYVLGSDGKPMEFTANADRSTEVTNNFLQPVTARFVRIEPTKWKNTVSLRLEILGCFTGTTPPVCSGDWKAFGNNCYYFADNEKVSFADAQTACQGMGGKLASVHSQDEQDFIGVKTKHDGTSDSWWGYWIGFSDQATEGTFVWSDGTAVDYTNWNSGEPNDWGNNEDCAGVAQKKNDQWNDASCSTEYAYVCKKQG